MPKGEEQGLQEKYAKIWNLLSASDRAELKIFEDAVRLNLKKFSDDPKAEHKRNLDASRRGLRELVQRLEAQYLKSDEVFPNRIEALHWLQSQGFSVKKTKLYADSARGLLRIQRDKSVLKKDVEKYAKTVTFLGSPKEIAHENQIEKLRLERERLKKQNELLSIEIEEKKGKYILRSEHGREQVGLIILLEAYMKNLFFSKVGDWIAVVDGNQKRLGDLEAEFKKDLDETFRTMARADYFTITLRENNNVEIHAEPRENSK